MLTVININRWPPEARRFVEVITAAVESFDPSSPWRRFDYHKSPCDQLRDRLLELDMPDRFEAVRVVENDLSERECADICLSLRLELN